MIHTLNSRRCIALARIINTRAKKIIYNPNTRNIVAYSLPGIFLSGMYYNMLNKGESTISIKKQEYIFKLMGTIIWWPSEFVACLFKCSKREQRLWNFKYEFDNNLKLEATNKTPKISTKTILSNYDETSGFGCGPEYLSKIIHMALDKNSIHQIHGCDIQKAITISFFQEFRRFPYLWKTNTFRENLVTSIGGVTTLLLSSLLMRRPVIKMENINLPWIILVTNLMNLTHTALAWPGSGSIPEKNAVR